MHAAQIDNPGFVMQSLTVQAAARVSKPPRCKRARANAAAAGLAAGHEAFGRGPHFSEQARELMKQAASMTAQDEQPKPPNKVSGLGQLSPAWPYFTLACLLKTGHAAAGFPERSVYMYMLEVVMMDAAERLCAWCAVRRLRHHSLATVAQLRGPEVLQQLRQAAGEEGREGRQLPQQEQAPPDCGSSREQDSCSA